MSDILILLVLAAGAVWGYFLMGRLDHFLDTHVVGTDDEESSDDEDHRGK